MLVQFLIHPMHVSHQTLVLFLVFCYLIFKYDGIFGDLDLNLFIVFSLSLKISNFLSQLLDDKKVIFFLCSVEDSQLRHVSMKLLFEDHDLVEKIFFFWCFDLRIFFNHPFFLLFFSIQSIFVHLLQFFPRLLTFIKFITQNCDFLFKGWNPVLISSNFLFQSPTVILTLYSIFFLQLFVKFFTFLQSSFQNSYFFF